MAINQEPRTGDRALGRLPVSKWKEAYVYSVYLIGDRAAVQSGAFGLASYKDDKQQKSQNVNLSSMGIERRGRTRHTVNSEHKVHK